MMEISVPKITLDKLYDLFYTKALVKLSKPEPKTPTKARPEAGIVNTLTPITQSIYNTLSPQSQRYLLVDIMEDNLEIERLASKAEGLDPDYEEKMENNGLGFFMEDYISMHCRCPVCGEPTLRKYSQSNVPVVDLVCINEAYHMKNNKCCLFQVKISLGNDYFNLGNKKIVVGSRVYGEQCHLVKGTNDIEHKFLVPGYICIKLNRVPNEIQMYTVEHSKSFVLIPNYQNTSNNFYYQYIDIRSRFGKNIITWNSSMVSLHKISTINIPTKIRVEYFDEIIIINPYKKLIN